MDKAKDKPTEEFFTCDLKPGIYDMPEEEYRALDALNWSLLKWMGHCAETFIHEYREGSDEDSDAKLEGRMLHTAILEPHLYSKRYATAPEKYPSVVKIEGAEGKVENVDKEGSEWSYGVGRGAKRVVVRFCLEYDIDANEYVMQSIPPGNSMLNLLKIKMSPWSGTSNFCKAWAAGIREKGIEPVKHKMHKNCQAMASKVLSTLGMEAFLAGKKEPVVIWDDPETGIKCKAKLDTLDVLENEIRIADLKKVANSADWEAFANLMLKPQLQYTGQMAWYSDGVRHALGRPVHRIWRFIAIENFGSHVVQVHKAIDDHRDHSGAYFEDGRCRYMSYIKEVKACMESGVWPAHTPDVEMDMVPPAWQEARLQARGWLLDD